MAPRRIPLCFLRNLCIPILFAFMLSAAAHASDLQIVQKQEAYVGQELTLSLQGSSLSQRPLLEWYISGDVKPILLRNGGMECAFTPSNTSAIGVEVVARDNGGQTVASANLAIAPRYFDVSIEQLEEDPLLLWDLQAKEERPTSELSSNRPIRFETKLVPSYPGELHYTWTFDASTSLLSGDDSPEITMTRSEIGDSELSVQVFNAAGILLGRSSHTVSITIPSSRLEDSVRQKAGWADWLEAQSLWDQNRYSEGMEQAKRAAAAVPEDTDIAGGFKVMSANYGRVLRALELQERGSAQREKNQLADALKTYRRARIVWPMSETDTNIKELEEAIDAIRLQRQQAEWLKDTASAYDQEGLLQEALEFYNQSQALAPSQPVEERVARISQRLALIAEADRLAGEGSTFERNGKLVEAIESYRASIERNPDEALVQHVNRLEEIVSQRRKQAAVLLREGAELQKRKQEAEALLRYRESMAMWPSPDAQKRIDILAKTVQLPQNATVRTPEDFGIGTKADAARLLLTGNKLYGEKRYREALAQYRKSYAISQDQVLSEQIRKLEKSLKEYEAIQASNKLIKEANLLYNQGLVREAAAKYRESLAAHPNAEVEAFLKRIENTIPVSPDVTGQGK